MSWVIINKQSGKAVCELFNRRLVDRINTRKYQAVPAGEYLVKLNRKIKQEAA